MNKLKVGAALLLVASLGTSLSANGFYTKLSGGISNTDADRKDGSTVEVSNEKIFSLAVGKSIEAFDVELEYTRSSQDWENKTFNSKGDGKSAGYYLNGYYNIDIDSSFTPYVGVGIGRLKYDDSITSSTETSYQGMLGCAYAINDNFDLSLEYKYRKADYDTVDLQSDNYVVGVKYKF